MCVCGGVIDGKMDLTLFKKNKQTPKQMLIIMDEEPPPAKGI